jgi:hypothetical protein
MLTTTHAPGGPHYPSQLKLFTECRRRYLLKVVERRRIDEPFSPALAKGKAAHSVLKLCADQLMGTPAGCPADLRSLVESHLPREPYPSELTWRADVKEIVAWVKYGLSYIDPDATILGSELFLKREHAADEEIDAFSVGAVLDLVLLRRDDEGEPFLEVVDYKSGRSGWANPLSAVITRFVLKRLITRHLSAGRFGRVVYTELYLAERAPRHLEIDLQLCLERWDEVKHLVAEIGAETAFPPSPSPLCRFCCYNGAGCFPGEDDTADDGELW